MKKQFVLAVLLMLFTFEMGAQERWAVEFRPQVNFPTQQPDVMDLKTGYGFEAMLSYKFMPHLGVYAGWGWNSFEVDEETQLGELEIDETGYSFGLRFIHPINNSVSYLVGLGGIYKHFEAENSSGDITGDSDHELGFEIQGGLVLEFGRGFDLRPQVIYRSLSATSDLGTLESEIDLQYLSIGIGIAKKF